MTNEYRNSFFTVSYGKAGVTEGDKESASKDALKHNIKQCGISVDQWETVAGDRARWRAGIKQGVELLEAKRLAAMGEKRATRKSRLQQQQAGAGGGDPSFVFGVCQRDYHSRIGLVSHSRTHRSELPTSSSS